MTSLGAYSKAFSALEALEETTHLESLAELLGDMRINVADGLPMDPAQTQDWSHSTQATHGASDPLATLVHFLEAYAARYETAPTDLYGLIIQLKMEGSAERKVAQSMLVEE